MYDTLTVAARKIAGRTYFRSIHNASLVAGYDEVEYIRE